MNMLEKLSHNIETLVKTNAETTRELGSSLVEYARTSNEKGYRAEKPKLTAENPIVLVQELQAFKRYMNECKIVKKSTWFQQARYAVVAQSRAQIAIEELIIDKFANEAGFQEIYTSRSDDQSFWSTLWNELEDYWQIKAGIEGGNEEKLARIRYRQIKLPHACTIPQIEKFMQEYETHRSTMKRLNLIGEDDFAEGVERLRGEDYRDTPHWVHRGS